MQKRHWFYFVVVITLLIAAILGWHWALPPANYPQTFLGTLWNWMDSVYYGIKLAGGDFSDYPAKLRTDTNIPASNQAYLATVRTIGLLVTIVIALFALFEGVRAWFFAVRRRMCHRDFDLVVGYGKAGRGIAQHLASDRKKRVLSICRSSTSFDIREARRQNIELYAGDAFELARGRKLPFAPLLKARRIYVAVGSDTDTLTAADALAKALPDRKGRIWMHIQDQRLLERLRDVPDPSGSNAAERPQAFSLAEATAEHLVIHHRPMLTARASGQTRLHAVIIGFDNGAWSIAEQLVLAGTFPPPTYARPRLTIIDPEADKARQSWLARHAGLAPWADINFIQADLDAVAWTRPEPLLDRIEALDPPSLYVFARAAHNARPRDDSHALPNALALRHGMEKGLRTAARIFVVATARTEEALNFGQVDADLQDDLVLIGDAAQVAGVSIACNEVIGDLARAIHESYGGKPFDALSQTLRVSNRRAAIHTLDKLALLGFEQVNAEQPAFGLSPEAAGHLAALLDDPTALDPIAGFEHVRWCVDRTLEGWTEGPRDDEARHREQLGFGPLAYAKLSDAERKKDSDQLREVLAWAQVAQPATAPHGPGPLAPLRIVDLPGASVRAVWHWEAVEIGEAGARRKVDRLRLKLEAPIDGGALAPIADAGNMPRLSIFVPPEPPLARDEARPGRMKARREAYAKFAAGLAHDHPGVAFRLQRARPEGWNWLGKLSPTLTVDGITLPPFTIGFAGPRDLTETDSLRERLLAIIEEQERSGRPLRLVTGLAKGADALMIALCKDRLQTIGIASRAQDEEAPQHDQVDWVDEGLCSAAARQAFVSDKDVYVEISRRILDSCDLLVAVHDGSPGKGAGGTADTIERASILGRETVIVQP